MTATSTVRILLAEDNPADIFLLQQAFANASHVSVDLMIFMDGEAAVNFVASTTEPQLHLIILDLNLPKKDGSDILQAIRRRREFGRVPVVVLTSSDSPHDRDLAREHGADSYFTKPSDLDEFFDLTRKLLSLAIDGNRRAVSVH